MDTDKATTVAGATAAVSSFAGLFTALAPMMPPGVDPGVLALIPPPYNMYVALGLLSLSLVMRIVMAYMTNKKVVNVTSDSQMSTPGK